MIDDLGYVQQSREEMEVLFTLLGGALRAWQRAGDEQPGVLAVGTDLQGSDDDSGGDRPVGASRVIVELNVPSYRAEAAKKAKQGRAGSVEPPSSSEANKPQG